MRTHQLPIVVGLTAVALISQFSLGQETTFDAASSSSSVDESLRQQQQRRQHDEERQHHDGGGHVESEDREEPAAAQHHGDGVERNDDNKNSIEEEEEDSEAEGRQQQQQQQQQRGDVVAADEDDGAADLHLHRHRSNESVDATAQQQKDPPPPPNTAGAGSTTTAAKRGVWGASVNKPAGDNSHEGTTTGGAASANKVHHHNLRIHHNANNIDPAEINETIQHGHLPFVAASATTATAGSGAPAASSSNKIHHGTTTTTTTIKASGILPPSEGFVITARVYVDPHDKLAHFDEEALDGTRPIQLPYWDCGVTGTTTSPLPLKDAYFRSVMGTSSTTWTGVPGEDNGASDNDIAAEAHHHTHHKRGSRSLSRHLYPVLFVPLQSCVMELNSGVSKQFTAGNVVLLEDIMMPGHTIKPVPGQHELQVLFVTLPQQHYHTGKENLSIKGSVKQAGKIQDPCPDMHPGSAPGSDGIPPASSASSASSNGRRNNRHNPFVLLSETMKQHPLRGGDGMGSSSNTNNSGGGRSTSNVASWGIPRKVRLTVLSAIGGTLTTLAADFFGKTAPLWLAVGVGGTCFVAGGTYGFVRAGDSLLTFLELLRERHRLYSTDVDDDEDEAAVVEEEEEVEEVDDEDGGNSETRADVDGRFGHEKEEAESIRHSTDDETSVD